MEKLARVGNHGPKVRSDLAVKLAITASGGQVIRFNSKVKALYGKANTHLVQELLNYFEIEHVQLTIDDSGALPLVIAARIEAAINQLIPQQKQYLPELVVPIGSSPRERNRFSRLYLPGNSPRLMINAGLHHPDGVILDLEDAVAPDKKQEARYMVRNALRGINFYGAERMVRINQIPAGLEDLEYIVPHGVQLILVPKCESADQIHQVNQRIRIIQQQYSLSNDIWLMPIVESAKGVLQAYEIAASASNIVALAIGLEDYTADLATCRTPEATESFFARSMVVNAARAAGIQPIDSVFSDVGDRMGLIENVKKSKALGFDGMGCIHPRQIRVIHEYFAPDSQEIEKAKRIYHAFISAREAGLGVVSLGTKMIDPPVVKRAQRTIEMAIKTGKLSINWREADA